MKYRITAGSEVSTVEGNPMVEAERLFKLTGTRPVVEKIDDSLTVVREASPQVGYAIPAQPSLREQVDSAAKALVAGASATIVTVPRGEGHIDEEGKLRSTIDVLAAAASGFAMKQPLFARGTRVVDLGVENARTSRLEHEALPLAADAHQDLAQTIRAEHRRDFTVTASNLLLLPDGRLTTREKPNLGIPLSERSFPQLVGRLEIPAGGAYLTQCPAGLRATNVNHWIDARLREESLSPEGSPKKELQLRMRGPNGKREIFAVTGPRYSSYDADMIAEAVAQACPQGARGTVHYDGYRAHGEVLFHSTVQPEHYVAGEVFRAGVSWSTDDTGGGAIVCRAMVFQNLCLNLIIIDQSEQETVRLRHQGSVEKLAEGFRRGFASAMEKIDHFVKAWAVACEEPIADAAVSLDDQPVPTVRELLIASAVRGMLDRELVTVRGRREDVVQGVVRAWQADGSGAGLSLDGMNRAALANALTRYAHESGDLDPWEQDQLQVDAGRLVYGAGQYSKIPLLGMKGA